MTWPTWIPRFRLVKSKPPKLPSVLAAFSISAALQPNNGKAGSRSMTRVCADMQQKQHTINGWNYACRFRS